MTTLFLDFDGVLHSHPCEESLLFSQMPLLMGVLDQLPHVDIVISSTWRRSTPLEAMRLYFPEHIRHRIIAVTPVWRPENSPYVAPAFERQREIEAWMTTYRPGQSWVAVDDWVYNFEPGCDQLVLTNHEVGLTSDTANRLLLCLQELH